MCVTLYIYPWKAQWQVGTVFVYCDGVGRRVLCLRNDIPMKQHYKRSKDPCLSVLYRFIHSCVSNRKQKFPFHPVLNLVIHKFYFLSAPKLEIGLEDDTEIKMAY